MNQKTKKLLIRNFPYVIIGLYCSKLGQTWQFAQGVSFPEKLLHIVSGLEAAFSSPLPSLVLSDLLIGACCGLLLRLAVYLKNKNAKKYRHNTEYGSARWSA